MIEKVEGIILFYSDYLESSKILTIITEKYGIIKVIAKGCKNIKSPLRSVCDKLTYGNFNIYYKKDKLSTLSSVDIIDNFKYIKKDINKISYATYILDLTYQVIKQTSASLFFLLISALKKIDEGFDPLVIMNIIELKYLDFLGVLPVIDGCSLCGSKSIKTLSIESGGYICSNCYTSGVIFTDKAIKLIRMFYYVDISKINKLDISEKVKNEINSFLNEYYLKYTGIYLKSKNFINNLNKLAL